MYDKLLNIIIDTLRDDCEKYNRCEICLSKSMCDKLLGNSTPVLYDDIEIEEIIQKNIKNY